MAVLKIVELANKIARRAPSQAGDRSNSVQPGSVTDRARRTFATTGCRQLMAFCDAARRHVGGEMGSSIAHFKMLWRVRDLNDAATNRLRFVTGQCGEEPPGDTGLRHGVGFYDPDRGSGR